MLSRYTCLHKPLHTDVDGPVATHIPITPYDNINVRVTKGICGKLKKKKKYEKRKLSLTMNDGVVYTRTTYHAANNKDTFDIKIIEYPVYEYIRRYAGKHRTTY